MRLTPGKVGSLVDGVVSMVRFIVVCAVCLAAPRMCGQNTYTGTSFISGNTEFGDSLTAGNVTIGGNISFNENSFGSLQARNLFWGSPFYSPDSGWDFDLGHLPGRVQFWSNYIPSIPAIWVAGASWLHATTDFGDLTYTNTDTPAYNLGQQFDGSGNAATINFTGYDSFTTWAWQKGGLDAIANSTSPNVQLALDGNGNLTVSEGFVTQITPETGNVDVTFAVAKVAGADQQGNQFSLDTGNIGITFYDNTLGATSTLTSAGLGALSIAIGEDVIASGSNAFAIGHRVLSPYLGSVAIGTWNEILELSANSSTTWYPTEPIFIIGNGTDADHPSNALLIQKDGAARVSAGAAFNADITTNGTISTSSTSQLNFVGNTTNAQAQGDIPMARYEDYH